MSDLSELSALLTGKRFHVVEDSSQLKRIATHRRADVIKQEPEEATAPEEHACEWSGCHTVFGERAELVTHIEKTHIEPLRGEEWTCLWADCSRLKKPFNARYKLLIHMRVHSGERPNKCTVRTSPLLVFLCGGFFVLFIN